MYHAFGLLQPGSNFTLEEAATRLARRFPNFTVRREGDEVHITKPDWELKIRIDDGAHVQDEAAGLAGRIAGLEPAEGVQMEACNRRVEMWSDTQDPFIEHLGDFHAAVEVLKSFEGLIAVDPNEPSIM